MYVSTSTTLLIWEMIAFIDDDHSRITHIRHVDSRPMTILAPDANK